MLSAKQVKKDDFNKLQKKKMLRVNPPQQKIT